jgi:hypothetical protein
MFKKHNQTPEYDEDALRRDVFAALERARQARIHSVVIQRVIHGVADIGGGGKRRPATLASK